jgi:hypothetical protein
MLAWSAVVDRTGALLGRPPIRTVMPHGRLGQRTDPVKLAELSEPAQDKDVPLTPRRRV